MTIVWRNAYSDISYTSHEKDPGLFYLLTGLDANATYFIKVHLLSKEASISVSDEMSVTTNAKRTYFRIALNLSPVDELGNWCYKRLVEGPHSREVPWRPWEQEPALQAAIKQNHHTEGNSVEKLTLPNAYHGLNPMRGEKG